MTTTGSSGPPLPDATRAARLAAMARLSPCAGLWMLRGKLRLRAGDLPGALAAFRAAVAADSRAALIDWGLWPRWLVRGRDDVRSRALGRLAAWWAPGAAARAPQAARIQDKAALRAWAAANGFATAPLVAQAPRLSELDWSALPRDRIVIKPTKATYRKGVVILQGGFDRMVASRVDRADLPAHTAARWQAEGCADQPVLVEAMLVDGEADRHPDFVMARDIKVFAVAGHPVVALVQDRNGPQGGMGDERSVDVFDIRGAPVPRIRVTGGGPVLHRPPPGVAAVIAEAARASRLLPEVMRFDFYATKAGPVLGEVTAFPLAGIGFNPFGARLLEQLWAAWPDPDLGLPAVR